MAKYSSEEAFFKRLNQLAETKKTPVKENRTIGTLINYERGADGVAYGIIKENHSFYIKKAGIKPDLNASDFAYIGGLENITNYQYHSLSVADKQRNMMLTNINESVKVKINKSSTKMNINEDIARDEIDQAASAVPELDAAAASDTGAGADMGVDPAASGIDQTNPVIPDLGDEEAIPEPTGAEGGTEGGLDAPEASTDEPTGDGSELPTEEPLESPDGATMTTGESDEKELEKALGKITNTIRKTEMQPVETKSMLKTFISAFKDKLPELEIEDRKEIANGIIKVVAGGEEDLENSMPDETEPEVDETQQCAECGSFTQYAESRGYTKESIMECGDEELGSLIGGYATAHGEGKNDGDGKSVSLFTNDEIAESLKNDYGHEKYVTEVLEPHMNQLREGTDEDQMAQIDELSWGGIKNAASSLGSGIKNAASGIGNAYQAAKTGVGQGKVADIGANIKQGIGGVGSSIKQGVQNVGTGMAQGYNKGVQNDEIQSINKLAQELKVKIDSLNAATVKAGGQPIDPKKIIDILSQQLTVAPPSKIANNPGAIKAFQNRGAASMGSLAMKENIEESAMINTTEPFKVVPKTPPAVPGKKNTEIMAGGNPTNNTTAFKMVSKNAPAQPGAGKKTIMGEGEVDESVDAMAKSTTAVTTAKVDGSGEVNKTGFKLISKNAPAQPGAGKKTIMGENQVDPGNVEVQPNMIKEVEEVEPDNDADDKTTNLDFGGSEESSVEAPETSSEETAEETPEIAFSSGADNLGLGGLEPKGAGTSVIDINVDGNTKKLNIQLSETKMKNYIKNQLLEISKTGKLLSTTASTPKVNALNKMINETFNENLSEISTGLAQKASNMANMRGDMANNSAGSNSSSASDPIAAAKSYQQSAKMGEYINPMLKEFLASKGITKVEPFKDGLQLFIIDKSGENYVRVFVSDKYPNGYNLGSGDSVYSLTPQMIQILPVIVKRVLADTKQPETPTNQLEGSMGMNESETKVRAYIRQRIEENAGLRKPSLNEDTKSAKIKELDKIIDEQYGVYKSVVKKK